MTTAGKAFDLVIQRLDELQLNFNKRMDKLDEHSHELSNQLDTILNSINKHLTKLRDQPLFWQKIALNFDWLPFWLLGTILGIGLAWLGGY